MQVAWGKKPGLIVVPCPALPQQLALSRGRGGGFRRRRAISEALSVAGEPAVVTPLVMAA